MTLLKEPVSEGGADLHADLALRLQPICRALVAVKLLLALLEPAPAADLDVHSGDLGDGKRIPDAHLAPGSIHTTAVNVKDF